jgi:hypothetical protein
VKCFISGKKKEDHQVWNNKLGIGATYDSEFQNNEVIRNLSEKSVICHNCIKTIEKQVKMKKE